MENAKLQESGIIVFAGAGASAGLGMPTTPEFINLLRQGWPNLNHLIGVYMNYTKDVGEPKKADEPIDSEELRDWLSHMQQMARCTENLSNNQPFETKVSSTLHASQFINALLTNFDSVIRDTYGEVNPEKAYKHYSPFLSVLSHHNVKLIPFFTTNYDLVLESLAGYSDLDWYIETGIGKRGTTVHLDVNRFKNVSPARPQINLFKLHGSTDWWRNKQTKQVEHVRFGISPGQNYEELLIYPTREKFDQVSEEPFSFFYDMLNHYLSSEKLRLCIVIGYSFRDKIINEKFSPAIKRGLRLLILDRSMEIAQLQRAFGESGIGKSDIENKVRIEHIEFGSWRDERQYHKKLTKVLGEELG